MNLRRMNASERGKLYGKFAMIMIIFWGLVVMTYSINPAVSKYKIPLENRSCFEIYNKTVAGQLYADSKNKTLYKPESVILYYIENCQGSLPNKVKE